MTLPNVSVRSIFAGGRNLALTLTAAIAGAAMLLIGAIPVSVPAQAQAAALTAETEMFIGDPNAKVTVYEYISMTCPHCARFHNEQLPAIKKAYVDTGKVKFVLREFPLDRAAFWGAILARCSGKDRFFAFIDIMFKRQSAWSSGGDPMQALTRLGTLGGVSESQFKACLADKKLGDGILTTRQTGSKKYEINATPGFVINGEKADSVYDLKTFAAVVDPLLR